MKLNKERIVQMRKDKKTMINLFIGYIICCTLFVYSIKMYPYYVSLGVLLICTFLFIVMYQFKEKILYGK